MNKKQFKPNRNYGFSLYFAEDEKQWLKVLAERDGISMAEELRKLIMAEKNQVIEGLNKRYRKEKNREK